MILGGGDTPDFGQTLAFKLHSLTSTWPVLVEFRPGSSECSWR